MTVLEVHLVVVGERAGVRAPDAARVSDVAALLSRRSASVALVDRLEQETVAVRVYGECAVVDCRTREAHTEVALVDVLLKGHL
jgi:hypothetical protein